MADNRLEFTFQDCLGRGGFGEVYLATVKKAGITRQMAVKVLKEGLDDQDDAVQRLRDEGRILGMLNHPAILGATDMCRIEGRIALVMEYVEGMDLAKTVRRDRLMPPKCAVQAIGEIADALHAAWSTPSPETGNPLRMLHRDIKPENIRLTTKGLVKLLDFGVARSGEMKREAKTRMGELPFTPGFAAPESIRAGEQSHKSDVYALGVTLYSVLVGETLYENMGIGEQFGTAAVEEDYKAFLVERLAKLKVDDARIRDLVTSMLAYEVDARPEAKDVSDRCEEIAKSIDGPTLQKWARGLTFPTIKPVKDAAFTGRTIVADPPEVRPGAGAAAAAAAGLTSSGGTGTSSLGAAPPKPNPVKRVPTPAAAVNKATMSSGTGSQKAAKAPKATPAAPPAEAGWNIGMIVGGLLLVGTLFLGTFLVLLGVAMIALVMTQ